MNTTKKQKPPPPPTREVFHGWAGNIAACALDKGHATIANKISERMYDAYKLGRKHGRREAEVPRLLAELDAVRHVHEIVFRMAGVALVFYDGPRDADGFARGDEKHLVTERYYPTFEECVRKEHARLVPKIPECPEEGSNPLAPTDGGTEEAPDGGARGPELASHQDEAGEGHSAETPRSPEPAFAPRYRRFVGVDRGTDDQKDGNRQQQPEPTGKEDAMRLGELIADLKKYDRKAYVRIDRSPVGLAPSGIASYRGYYEDLAINVEGERASTLTNGAFIELLEKSIGSTITGYKGGNYVVATDTRVWISNYGEASGSLVIGARYAEWGCVYIKWRNDDEDGS